MFDISFTEILVVGAASLSTLGVKGTVSALKSIKSFFLNIKTSMNDYLRFLDESDANSKNEDTNIIDTIIDLDGNLQNRYDLSKIMPEVHKRKK